MLELGCNVEYQRKSNEMNKREVHYEDDYAWTTTLQGDKVMVSLEDSDLLEDHSWTRSRSGDAPRGRFYPAARLRVDGKRVFKRLHKLVQKRIGFSGDCDHANGVKYDARRENLRAATGSQNQRNKGQCRNNKSGFKGVCWNKRAQKWRAQIKLNDKQKHLGLFTDIVAAARAYDKACTKLHGEEFGKTNEMLGNYAKYYGKLEKSQGENND